MTENNAPASANFEKLRAKLRELFELDKADLDFGIYRVLRARHKEIAEFLDKHLEKTVREALQSHGSLRQDQLQEDLRKAEQAARDLGVPSEQTQKVLEIREKLKAANDIDALADEVYSHLYTFFSRYYQEGDFLGLQRSTVHGREKYMIPYNGEEVKLVWANMDQYYIKSSELLRDYVFQIAPGAGTLLEAAMTERFTVHFKLVEADTEKDNRKTSSKTTRAFALDDESPFVEDASDTLTIRFRYREHTAERNLQDKLNADTEKTLADNLPAKWKAVLFAPDPAYQGKDKKDTRTILQKHLRSYTAKYQFDYFIHKDLGSFLRRELDFYVKNEVMYLDDIEDTSAPKAEEYLSKIRALRRCAVPVIGMLEQLENFQKKLWLKKKFVVETRHCMTLDRVPEKLYPEIAASAAQREEWVKLYAINEIKKDMAQPGYSEPLTVEFLKANPYLMLDTRYFSRDFMLKLLAAIENMDDSLDGVCFQGDNFQALQVMSDSYREQIECIHIDPPYNTKTSGFLYRNNYQHSSWLSMMQDRLLNSFRLLNGNGSFLCHIDENEYERLHLVLENSAIPNAGTVIWDKRNPMNAGRGIATQHEYVVWRSWSNLPLYLKNEAILSVLQTAADIISKHGGVTAQARKEFATWVDSNPDLSGGEKAYRYLDDQGRVYQSVSLRAPEPRTDPKFHQPLIHPITKKPCPVPPNGFSRTPETLHAMLLRGEILFGEDESTQPRQKVTLVADKKRQVTSVIQDARKGKADLDPLGLDFPYCHPVSFYTELLAAACDSPNGMICDYFAGSGTTGHAVIALNRNEKSVSKRKYILAEVGEQFDAALVPRLKKVAYSADWKDGKPQNRNTGISHAFKIVRLEGYEDALNNLRLKRTPEQEAALQSAPEKARDQYLLGYFLDVESAGSASLLDLDQFRDPFAYKLKVATSSAGETVDTTIDLVETFNWLLGLKVKHIDAQKGFLTVTGEKRAGGRTLVIWRTLSDDPIADNKALEGFLGKIKVNPADTEFDYIYINGSHTLTDPHNKVHLIEEAFQRLMFDTPDFGMEA